ncbi:hypothetical protein JHK87_043237 [Glycine soja]|nr:hypothetical protein JHK87_043237 [Glycine soja]
MADSEALNLQDLMHGWRDFRSRARSKTLPYLFSFSSRLKSLFSFSSRPKSAGNRSVDTHIVVGRTHRTPYTAGKPTLSSLEPTEPPTLPENPYCHRSNPIEPTLSWVEENPRYRVATRVLKQSSVLKGQSFLREILRLARDLGDFLLVGIHRDQTVSQPYVSFSKILLANEGIE